MVGSETSAIPSTSRPSELLFAPLYWDSVLTTYCPENSLKALLLISESSCLGRGPGMRGTGLFRAGAAAQGGWCVVGHRGVNSETDCVWGQTYSLPWG